MTQLFVYSQLLVYFSLKSQIEASDTETENFSSCLALITSGFFWLRMFLVKRKDEKNPEEKNIGGKKNHVIGALH